MHIDFRYIMIILVWSFLQKFMVSRANVYFRANMYKYAILFYFSWTKSLIRT